MATAVAKIKNYFVEAIHELKKVTWPSKKEVTNYSILVIAMSLGVALFLGILDYLLNIVLELLLK